MSNEISAIAVFDNKRIKGIVRFTENLQHNYVVILVQISGLKKNALHGFHVHTYGDMSKKCETMCGHFNPYGKKHGGPFCKERHVGDLGNITTNEQGIASYEFTDKCIKLRGTKANIIGRGLVIHEKMDDCGLGNNKTSVINGNAGARIACAVIGYSS
jgi:Cu-Zn family superoxide dismutase